MYDLHLNRVGARDGDHLFGFFIYSNCKVSNLTL